MQLPLIVLAAGKGTRLQPLTNTVPKALLKVQGKPLIVHTLENVGEFISNIIIITNHLEDQFEKTLGNSINGIPVSFVHQPEQKGTAHALQCAKDSVQSDTFYCMYGDDFYDKAFFEDISKVEGNAIVGKKMGAWQKFGVIVANGEGNLEKLVEKPAEFVSDLVNIGIFKLSKKIFEIGEVGMSERGEMELTDLVTNLSQQEPVKVVESDHTWIPIGYPWHLLDLAEYALSKMESSIEGTVETGAIVKGKLQLGKGSVVKAGTYIDGNVYIGENCSIGPNTYIRTFTSIGDNCNIGANTEIKGSILGNNTKVPHLSYVPDSILGNNVNYSAGTITANLKHDGSNVQSMVNGELVDTGRAKFGTVMGDNAKTGIHTSIFPGRKIWNDKTTLPGDLVKQDVV